MGYRYTNSVDHVVELNGGWTLDSSATDGAGHALYVTATHTGGLKLTVSWGGTESTPPNRERFNVITAYPTSPEINGVLDVDTLYGDTRDALEGLRAYTSFLIALGEGYRKYMTGSALAERCYVDYEELSELGFELGMLLNFTEEKRS